MATELCTRCNKPLNEKKIKWLELSITDGNYYPTDIFPPLHKSQGCFPFGTACAKQEIKDTIKKMNTKKEQ